MGANTGIGLSAQQYYYYGAGLEDLVTAQGVSWTPNFTGNATITIPETQQAPTGQAVQRTPSQSVPLSSATDVTPPITAIGNGSFEGQIQRWNNGERNYQLIRRSRTMPTSLVLVDELGDGSTNGTLTNFPPAQRWVPVLGTNQAYSGLFNDINFNNGVSLNLRHITSNSNSNVLGSWGMVGRPTIGSLLISGSVILQVVQYPTSTFTVVYATASGTDPEIQAAFEYPNVFNIQPFDSTAQGYVGNFTQTAPDWIRGVRFGIGLVALTSGGNPEGSVGLGGYPTGTILTASNGAVLRSFGSGGGTSTNCNVVSGTNAEIQAGFQWPNHFAVTPPP